MYGIVFIDIFPSLIFVLVITFRHMTISRSRSHLIVFINYQYCMNCTRRLQWQQVVFFGASLTCPVIHNRAAQRTVRFSLTLIFRGADLNFKSRSFLILCASVISRYYDANPFDTSVAAFRFNALLSSMCRERGCRVADPDDDLFDFQTGQVHPFFHSEPAEMHCSIRPFFFWHRALLNALPDDLRWCYGTTQS